LDTEDRAIVDHSGDSDEMALITDGPLSVRMVNTSTVSRCASTSWALNLALLKSRRADGNFVGSYDLKGPWAEDGGRVYTTAMATLSLQAAYRYGTIAVR